MFGWIMNRIQRRESGERVMSHVSEKLARAQLETQEATGGLRAAIHDRRSATAALRVTLNETLERVRGTQ